MTMIILDTIVRFIPIIFIAWIMFGKAVINARNINCIR
jgi:hypothetical protein